MHSQWAQEFSSIILSSSLGNLQDQLLYELLFYRFMLEALPNIDWSAEETIPALNLILKRINSTFTKITDKPDLMVSTGCLQKTKSLPRRVPTPAFHIPLFMNHFSGTLFCVDSLHVQQLFQNFFWPYPLLLHRSEHWNVTVVLLKGKYCHSLCINKCLKMQRQNVNSGGGRSVQQNI